MRILIIGAGGHAQVIVDCLLRMAEAGHACKPIGYVDDNSALHGCCRLGLPILGGLAAINQIDHDALLIGIGDNAIRRQIYLDLMRQGEHFATALHPRAIVAPDVAIGAGSVIFAGAIVNVGSRIGVNVIVNSGAIVEHHNTLGDHSHIAPGVRLGGDVMVGEASLIGLGATVMAQRSIGCASIVGAGALVHRSVPDHTTVVGVPARRHEGNSMKAGCNELA